MFHARSKNPQHSHFGECAKVHTWKLNYFPQFVEDTLVLWETWSQYGTEKPFIIHLLSIIVCEADLEVLMLFVSQLVSQSVVMLKKM